MTASNPEVVRRCVAEAIRQSGLLPEEISYVNAHLTATGNDTRETAHLRCALCAATRWRPLSLHQCDQVTKSMIGRAPGACGAIECVATLLQMEDGFLHPSLNCEDLHPGMAPIAGRIPRECLTRELRTALKTSFGFGDVNACVIFFKPD